MKKIITYFVAFALVIGAFTPIYSAIAQVSTEDSGSTAGTPVVTPAGPATEDSGSTAGTPDNTSGGTGNVGGGSSSGFGGTGGFGGGSYSQVVTFSPASIFALGGDKFAVAFVTNIDAIGKVVFGKTSVSLFDNNLPSYGYENASGSTPSSTVHQVVITMTPGNTYFIRPTAMLGTSVFYGAEVMISPISVPTVEVPPSDIIYAIDNPSTGNVNGTTTIVEVPNTTDVGSVNYLASALNSVGDWLADFFSTIWNTVWGWFRGSVCRV